MESFLKTNLRAAHRILRSPLRELSVALVDDKTMRRIHRQFLRDGSSTDVMTFPLEFDRRRRPTSGEVVVCEPYARKKARELGTEPKHELLLYALHGLLHLNGFDDRNPRQYRRMHRMEDTILRRLGIGPVFNPKGSR